MAERKLTEWVKVGYPYMKREAGLAPWAMPEHGFNRIADEVGDDGLLALARPLFLAERVVQLMERAPEPAAVPPQAWQEAMRKWQYLPQLEPVIAAFLEVSGPLLAQVVRFKPVIDPAMVCRHVSVLLFAPFIDQGRALLEEVAAILGRANSPAEVIRGYGEAVGQRDVTTLEKIDRSILKYSAWQEWAASMQERLRGCRCTPKLVAVTPAPAADIIGLLVTMMKEGQAESSV